MKLPKIFLIVTTGTFLLFGVSACSPVAEPQLTIEALQATIQSYQKLELSLTSIPASTTTSTSTHTPIPTATFTPTKTLIPTATFTPTESLTPTITLTPTKTPVPTQTNTPTLAPTPFQLPFVDEFDTGLRPEWMITGDIPYVVDRTLATDGSTTLSIRLGDESLTDYIVDFKAKYWSQGGEYIGVRALNVGNMIALGSQIESSGWYLFLVQNGNWNLITNSRLKESRPNDVHVVLNIKGNRLLVSYEDSYYSHTREVYFTEPYPKYGGVIFYFKSTYPEFDAIEYIKILPNP
jgi:hypothetical protein